ncbi:MAG: hypothetical protein JG777_915 [Clostridia bacterium]|nr:hypothetical protein [Clostridia bacterium]
MRKCRIMRDGEKKVTRRNLIKQIIKLGLMLVICFQVVFLTGCWDMVELEERAFVLGIGLDKGEKEGEITLTYQFALPSAMFGEGGGKGEKKVWNLAASSSTVIGAHKELLTRLNKVINLEHTRVLLIGEELAREGISKHMDFFFRDINMRRRTDVLIAQDKAQDFFNIMPPTANSTSDYLADIISQNEKRTGHISPKVDMVEMTKNLRRGTDFILAKVARGEKDIVMSGAGVFRKDKLIGVLGAEEVMATRWLKSDISKGTITLKSIDGAKDENVFEISEGRTKVKPYIQGEDVNFDVSIRVEGDIAEMKVLNFKRTVTGDFINMFEKAIEEEIGKRCNEIMDKAQREFETDFLDFGHLVKDYNFRWMKQHEDQWRDIFKKSRMNIKVDVNIRRVGLVK